MEHSMEALKQTIVENAERVEEELIACFGEENVRTQVIFDAEKYSLLGGGKRIRPFLVTEFCRLFGGNEKAALRFGAAVEMIHCYSLIHDDLPCMDDDDMRRGKPTNHKQFGYANALLAGDALLTKAFLTAASNPFVSANTALEAVRLMADAAGDKGMIGGQVLDLIGETEDLELDALLELHTKKTGALIECAALLGVLAAGYSLDSHQAKIASAYATKIGLAFQVIDDLLDMVGDEVEVGKTLGSDAGHVKTTFLTYFDEKAARAYATELTADAVTALADVENSERLTDLAVYLLERTY